MTVPDQDRWRRVQALFDAAVALPPDQRRDHVLAHCGADADLAREVLELLAADAEHPDFLDGLAAGLAEVAEDAAGQPLAGEPPAGGEARAADPLVGATLDRYTVVARLAAGGMGTVYRAERSDGAYAEQVAIKVIRPGLDTRQLLHRFAAERQILARLRHPNIANLLDGGVTGDGRPYLVMEHVAGRPLDRYCEQEQLPLAARLDLFAQVCRTVQHAHRNLVVHRDLKPGNILVTGDGVIKLMDFGIAKLLRETPEEAGAEGPATLPGLRVMTPGWAAPEQVRGEPATTATDVFGLGLVLYRLLTGGQAFGSPQSTAEELATAVCEEEPPAPSRAAAPSHARLGVDADLDTICLKALRTRPQDRYPSPEHLADDLARHRDGHPVLARPATLRYRTGKLLRRHRRAFLATASILVLAVGLGVWDNLRLASERDHARRQEAKATQVAAFLTDLFRQADPDQSRGADITARELLDRGAERVRTRLAGQPALQTEMLGVLGEVHRSLGLYGQSRTLLEEALDLVRSTHGADHRAVAEAAAALGQLEAEAGRFARADSLLRGALAVLQDQLGPRDPALAPALKALALATLRQGDAPAAEALYQRALAAWESEPPVTDPGYATCLNDLGLLWLEMGRRDQAETMLRRALDLQEQWLGADHPERANTLFNLSLLLQERGDHAAAQPVLRQVLALDRKHYAPDHPNVAYSLVNLASSLRHTGRFAAAESLYAEALAIRREVLAPGHPDRIKTLGDHGLSLAQQGRYAEAEPILRQAVARAREHLGRHRLTAGRLDDLGWLLRDLGRPQQALPLHREALAIKQEVLGPQHKHTAITLLHLGHTLRDLDRLSEARKAQQRALAIADAAFGPDNVFTATNATALARILLAQGNREAAAAHADRALRGMRTAVAPDNPRLAGPLVARALVDRAGGDLPAAERGLRSAHRILRDRLGEGHPRTAWSAVQLADVLLARGDAQAAASLAAAGEQVLGEVLPDAHPRIARARAVRTQATAVLDSDGRPADLSGVR